MEKLIIKDHEIKILFNGIKVNWELYKWSWNFENYNDKIYINFYAKWYASLPKVIKEIANVRNETDSMTDYFDTDKFKIFKDHVFFKPAAKAVIKNYERYIKQTEKNNNLFKDTKQEYIKIYNDKINFIKNFITNF